LRLSEPDFSALIPGPPLHPLRNQRFLFRRTLMNPRLEISWPIRRLGTTSSRYCASHQEAFQAGDCLSRDDIVFGRSQSLDVMRRRGCHDSQQ
jgi:hypothetical protein